MFNKQLPRTGSDNAFVKHYCGSLYSLLIYVILSLQATLSFYFSSISICLGCSVVLCFLSFRLFCIISIHVVCALLGAHTNDIACYIWIELKLEMWFK